MRYLPPLLMLVLCGTVAGPATLQAAEEDSQQPVARKAVQQELRHRLPSRRAAAFRKLEDSPPLEAAKLLVQSGLADHQPEVRRAAYETLKTFGGKEEVEKFLLRSLEKQMGLDQQAQLQTGSTVPAPLIALLLGSKSKAIGDRLRESLDKWAPRSKSSAVTLIDVADELGAEADESALKSLWKLTRLKCFSDLFAFRRAVVQGMIRVQQPMVVGALIQLLPAVPGEVGGDIVRHLTKVTGQPHGASAEAWQAWWKNHKKDFIARAAAANPGSVAQFQAAGNVLPSDPPRQGLAVGAVPSYYGISVFARRMVFVVDISGSMAGARITASKRELLSALNALPQDCEFTIVVFNQAVKVWRPPYLVRATPAAKQDAARFVTGLNARGMTSAYDALEAAFNFDVEAVYFLTDGEPTSGKIVFPPAIVAAVSQANHYRRVSLYAIGIAPGVPGGPLDSFLQTIAAENYGEYRRVDQWSQLRF